MKQMFCPLDIIETNGFHVYNWILVFQIPVIACGNKAAFQLIGNIMIFSRFSI